MNISEKEYREKQQSILENYKQSLLTKDQIYDTFSIKLRIMDKETKKLIKQTMGVQAPHRNVEKLVTIWPICSSMQSTR